MTSTLINQIESKCDFRSSDQYRQQNESNCGRKVPFIQLARMIV